MRILILILVIFYLSPAYSDEYGINYYEKYISECSKNKPSKLFVPDRIFPEDHMNKGTYIFVSEELNIQCLKKNFEAHYKKQITTGFMNKMSWNNKSRFNWSGAIELNLPKITSITNFNCGGEGCRFVDDYIFFINNKYYYIFDNTHDNGFEIDFLIKKGNVLEKKNSYEIKNPLYLIIKSRLSTYSDNAILNFSKIKNITNDTQLGAFRLMDGKLEFYEKYYISKHRKSYLSTGGGGFWFDSKLSYQNEIIELLDAKDGICIEKDKFFINYDDNLDKTKKDISKHLEENAKPKWWLAALSLHKKDKWCIHNYSRIFFN